MDVWIIEVISKLNRQNLDILFGEHASKDKNLVERDVDNTITSIRFGKVDNEKSDQQNKRICFKNYFKYMGITYFVITEFYPDFIKIITVNKKKGKY